MTISNLFSDGSYWQSVAAVSPPPFFNPDVGFVFATDGAGVGDRRINFIGDYSQLPGSYFVPITLTSNPLGTQLYLVMRYTLGVSNLAVALPIGAGLLGEYNLEITLPNTLTAFSIEIARDSGGGVYVAPLNMGAIIQSEAIGLNGPVLVNGGSSDYDRVICYDSPVDYNNGRFSNPLSRTLIDLRYDICRRLGYSAQIPNLPPGMPELVDSFINDANEQLFERYPVMRLERWFTWQTVVGQRAYDIPIDCTEYLDSRHITGAWLQDDDAWFPLVGGINPLLYNQTMFSLPQYYEVRDALYLWPIPDKPTYLFHLKGQFGANQMVLDEDTCTVDSRAVFLHALANAKAHYGQGDAVRYDRQLEILIGRYTAGAHYSKRYIPNESPAVGLPRPIRQVPGG